MPSASLLHWQNDRMPRLQQVEHQCTLFLAAPTPNLQLTDESLCGYVLLLSAHFQGFCRDLCSEAAQVIASKVRLSLRPLVERHFSAQRNIDRGNPNVENLRKDLKRFGFTLNLAADAANVPRLQDLAAMNQWRNVAAHYGPIPAGTPLALPLVQAWRTACDGLATALDTTLYNELRKLLKRTPW